MENKVDYRIPRDIAARRPYNLQTIPFQQELLVSGQATFIYMAWLAFRDPLE